MALHVSSEELTRDAALRAAAVAAGALEGATDAAGLALTRRAGVLTLCLRTGRDRMEVTIEAEARQRARGGSLLARAVGGRRGDLVIDATAGLGGDAAELAARGYRVLACERHPVLALMLREANAAGAFPPEVHEGDARVLLPLLTAAHRAHAVCIDPMFAPTALRARAGKEAQVLQHLAGPPSARDDAALFAAAWPCGDRIVVKRALRAPPIAPGVGFAVRGRAVRFDVYLTAGRRAPT